MAIYKLIYYANDVPKKSKKHFKDTKIICERTFHLNELSPEVQKRLFGLMPHFYDLLNINLTVDMQNVQCRTYRNQLFISLGYFNDIYYLFGLPLDIESVIYSLGKVYIDQSLPVTSNRVVYEKPKLEVCLNNETIEYYTFSSKDSPNKVIQKAYEYYSELIRNLHTKFQVLEKRKILLQEQFEALNIIENKRLKQLKSRIKKADDLYEKEKYDWITKNGSKHLQLLYNLNYNDECEKSYIEERVKQEFEGWIIDYDQKVTFNYRSNPSTKAIKNQMIVKNKGLNADIVWIKEGFKDISSESEAVVVYDYLNQYRLYKKVD